MLTQDQLEKLESLTKHPRYGQILKDAIEVWKENDVTPISSCFGVSGETEYFEFINPGKKQCCLLGASLINYKIPLLIKTQWCKIYNSLNEKYSISISEINDIWRGFDDYKYYDTEAYDFGNQIRKIINPIKV